MPGLTPRPFIVNFLQTSYLQADFGANGMLKVFLEAVACRPIQLAANSTEADLTIVLPFDLAQPLRRHRGFLRTKTPSFEALVQSVWPHGPTLFVSFENLQHPAWTVLGNLLAKSSSRRLTSYPRAIDPDGERFPYWWNFLDWPEYPRPAADYPRYGRHYSLERLMMPIPREDPGARLERACWVGSYTTGIRASLLNQVERTFGLDRYGEAGAPFSGPKSVVLEKYRYCMAAENSFGFGYDTEKLPEAWDAGCVPVGTFCQPMSDFNPRALDENDSASAYSHPLLLQAPDARPILDYLDQTIR